MNNLKIETMVVEWEFNGELITIDESFLIKGVKHVPSKNLVVILMGERGVAEELLAYRYDGTLDFSLRAPVGNFYYFSELPNGLGVTCGKDLNSTKVYPINFTTKALE